MRACAGQAARYPVGIAGRNGGNRHIGFGRIRPAVAHAFARRHTAHLCDARPQRERRLQVGMRQRLSLLAEYPVQA